MNSFNQFGITAKTKGFVGDKIDLDRILNVPVIIEDYRVEPSKHTGANKYEKCLYLQIRYQKEQRVVFVGSKNLVEMIEQVPKEKFPFETTIVLKNKRPEFS